MKECSNFIDLQWDYSAFPAPLGEETVFFSWWSDAKEIACKTGNPALVPGLGRSPGERMEQEVMSFAWRTSPKLPWRRSLVIRSSEMGWRESVSLPPIIPLNEVVVELVDHHKLFYGLDHHPVAILGAASPQLQSCSSGGNWQSCVLLGQGQRPCKTSHKTTCPCQDGWSRTVHVIWLGSFREHPWTLMFAIFFPY